MFHRSCNLIKSVSPLTVHQTDSVGCAVTALFHSCSRRQLHNLMHGSLKNGYKIDGLGYKCLQKFICPRRDFIWFSSISRNKDSKNILQSSADRTKDKQDFTEPPLKQHNQILAKDSCIGNEAKGVSNCDKTKQNDKKDKNSSVAEPHDNGIVNDKNQSSTGGNISPHILQTNEINISAGQNTVETHHPVDNTIYWVKQDHSSHTKNEGAVRTSESDVAEHNLGSNSTKLETNGYQSQVELVHQLDEESKNGKYQDENEAVKPANEIKLQKGKSPSILLEKAKSLLRKSSKSDDQNQYKDVGSAKTTTNMPPPPRKRNSVDLNRCSTERNFITPVRAMTDFLLKPSDLEGLRKTKRRSPYENDPPITVYWRKDVEAKAIDIWGSKENLLKEILKRDIERRRYQQNIFTVKRRLRDYRREQGRETEFNAEQNGLLGSTGKVVLTAIFINGGNFLCKLGAWWYTGSHSMFSEALHSLADTMNQLILAYGIYKSVQRADSDHPYGYTNMRYVSSLISGVAIFCLGSGLSCYHGVIGLTDPNPVESYYWAFLILSGSLVSEGATLLVAFNSVRKAAESAQMNVTDYVLRGNDPSINVILLEDAAAVLGVLLAGSSMGLSALYNSHIPDAVGSLLVGGLLAGVATFIIYTNVAALVGRSIPQERLDKINAELEADVMIRAIHDVKGIDMGNSLVRYKAEMDFDGGELTRSYLDKQDLNHMLEEVQNFKTIDELEEFMLKHGENIVDMMGGEIDRIELKLRKKHPEIRHCDLEIL